jgi:flavin reductase (DIM6/NTAB) family NADH-FMN oxidoreductase RutF
MQNLVFWRADGDDTRSGHMKTTVDPNHFRAVFGRFATGVAVITAADAVEAGGMTANAICSLSLDPLLVLVCFDNGSRTLPIVRMSGRFAVNLLGADQEPIARVFASKASESDKLDRVGHHFDCGLPMIDGAIAWVACDLCELIARGDHTIAVGEPTALGVEARGDPLLWYTGKFHAPSFSGDGEAASRSYRSEG